MRCPSCGSTDIRISRRRRRFAFVLRLAGYRRFRCRACWHGFWHLSLAPPDRAKQSKRLRPSPTAAQRRRRRLVWEAILFVVLIGIFFVSIRYLLNRH